MVRFIVCCFVIICKVLYKILYTLSYFEFHTILICQVHLYDGSHLYVFFLASNTHKLRITLIQQTHVTVDSYSYRCTCSLVHGQRKHLEHTDSSVYAVRSYECCFRLVRFMRSFLHNKQHIVKYFVWNISGICLFISIVFNSSSSKIKKTIAIKTKEEKRKTDKAHCVIRWYTMTHNSCTESN